MKYFTLPELCFSATAEKLGIANTPSPAEMRNLMLLTDRVLDPVRELWGKPLIVTSGYRCPALNDRIGGVHHSQHLHGLAADLSTLNMNRLENYRLYQLIAQSDIPYDQLIAEHKHHDSCLWVHISWSPTPRRQLIVA